MPRKRYFKNNPLSLEEIYSILGFIKNFPILWKTAIRCCKQDNNNELNILTDKIKKESVNMFRNGTPC